MSALPIMPGDGEEATAPLHEDTAAFAIDQESFQTLFNTAQTMGWSLKDVRRGNVEEMARAAASGTAPRIVIADLDECSDYLTATASLRAALQPGAILIAVGSENDVSYARRALRAGADDYIAKPLDSMTLQNAVQYLQRNARSAQQAEEKSAKIIQVLGVRGGIGSSSFASNLAWCLAEKRGQRTALIDLDLHFGTAALGLDVDPGHGLSEALENPDRIDEFLLTTASVKRSEMLTVFASEESLDQNHMVTAKGLNLLLDEIRNKFDCIVLDVPRYILPGNVWLMERANEVLLVSDQSLPSVRDCMRMVKALNGMDPVPSHRLIVSRVGKTHPAQIDTSTFERSIKSKIDLTLPEDHKIFADCANSGKTIGELGTDSKIYKMIYQFSGNFVEREEKAAKKGLFSFLSKSSEKKEKKSKKKKKE